MRQDPPDEVMLKDAVFGVTQMALSGMPTDSMMNAYAFFFLLYPRPWFLLPRQDALSHTLRKHVPLDSSALPIPRTHRPRLFLR